MTDTVSSPALATNAFLPLGLNATENGALPTLIVSVSSPVFTLMTDTVSSPTLATNAFLPLGLNATEVGPRPTAIGAPRTVLVLTLMTDTVSSKAFATYAVFPSLLNATETGLTPTLIVEITRGAANTGVPTGANIINVAAANARPVRVVFGFIFVLMVFNFRKESLMCDCRPVQGRSNFRNLFS